MKSKTFDGLPKHQCPKPGSPTLSFARLDFDAMKSLVERDASGEYVNAQVKVWIATDAAKNPNPPTETTDKRFHAALLSNIPFVVGGDLGLEMADALSVRGLEATLLGKNKTVLSSVDAELGVLIEEELGRHGVKLVNQADVGSINTEGEHIRVVAEPRFEETTEFVVVRHPSQSCHADGV